MMRLMLVFNTYNSFYYASISIDCILMTFNLQVLLNASIDVETYIIYYINNDPVSCDVADTGL